MHLVQTYTQVDTGKEGRETHGLEAQVCVWGGGESSHAQTREMELGGNQSPSRFPEAQEFSAITKSLKKRGSPGGMWGVQRADYVQRKPGAAEREN